MKTDDQLIFQSSKRTLKALHLPFNLSFMLLNFEKSILSNGHNAESSSSQFFEGNSQLYIAFNTLTQREKIHHYSFCVQFLNSILSAKSFYFQRAQFEQPIVSLYGYRKTGLLGFSEKTVVVVDNPNQKLTLISSGKKDGTINLRNYLMRESKDPKKHCVIFESIVKYEFKSSVRIYFQERSYQECRLILRRICQEVERVKLYQEVVSGMKSNPLSISETSHSLSTPENHILSQENLRGFYSLFDTLRENEDDELDVQRQPVLNISYKNISTNGNTYYLQEFFNIPQEQMVKILRSDDHSWNNLCIGSMVIEVSKGEKVFSESYLFNDTKYSVAYIMSTDENHQGRFLMKSIRTDKQEYEHSLDMEYVYITLLKTTNWATRMQVTARIDTGDSNRGQFIVEYLKQFENIYQSVCTSTIRTIDLPPIVNQKTIYFDANGEEDAFPLFDFQNDEAAYQLDKDVNPPEISTDFTGSVHHTSDIADFQEELQCLKHKHIFSPMKNVELRRMKEHYLDAEWVRDKEGGLLCINQRLVTEQKKVLKHVFSSLGKNLFSNKSLLNISLPASVCTKFSHLKMIANNFIYAPILMEEAVKLDPIERMKKMVTFLITIGNTGISSQKPFNPILGQTFEGMINGCPIYLQQVSHHPPASAYLFEGRGYSISGSIQPKVEATGINSVRCYSQKENRLCFEDGSVLYMSYPKIKLIGLLYGNRYFYFEGKNFIFDEKNLIYAEINYGQEKVSFLGASDDPIDRIYGKIYKVKPSLAQLFKSSKGKEIVIKDHVETELAAFDGTWTQLIKFNGVEYFNFRTDLPCVLEEKGCPLPSDSQFRSDIRRLIENNMTEAQSQKQRLEDLQRRDKALREKRKRK